MLDERPDRPAKMLAQQEFEQHVIASSFTPSASLRDANCDLQAQRDRDRNAKVFLENITEDTALSKLNTFCSKTKVPLEEKWICCGDKRCQLSYKSSLRKISVIGTGNNKKVAKRNAAVKMLEALKDSLGS